MRDLRGTLDRCEKKRVGRNVNIIFNDTPTNGTFIEIAIFYKQIVNRKKEYYPLESFTREYIVEKQILS